MIKITKRLYDEIINYAKANSDEEICGLIGGTEKDGVREARGIYFLENAEHSDARFFVDPAEQFAAIRDMRAKGIYPTACFHSHPKGGAKPSETDLRLALDENIIYIIISLNPEPAAKAFRVIGGIAEDENIAVM